MSVAGGYDQYAFVADLYDHVDAYRDRPDVAFYVQLAKDARGPVLEVGCGTGRVLIAAAREGVAITGLDASPHMLRVCRDRLAQESATVQRAATLVEADMRDFDLGRTFALVMVPFRPFQHLITVEDQLSCLASLRRHVGTGGRLVLDVFNPSLDALANRRIGEEFGGEPEFVAPDGRRVVRRHKIVAHDRVNQINHVELVYSVTHPDGRTERLVHAFPMRYLFRFEMEHLLARCGFEVEALYGGFDRSALGSRELEELIFVARARG